ncbi:hypothetical protein IHE44_0007635, partial [Lamprotornis superbus]
LAQKLYQYCANATETVPSYSQKLNSRNNIFNEFLFIIYYSSLSYFFFNNRIRLCFFEHLEKWFAESLSNSYVFVAAKKEELNSILLLHLKLHQQKQEIQTNIYNGRAPSSSNNLESELHNHLESIKVTVRSYQQHLEEALGKLRDLN